MKSVIVKIVIAAALVLLVAGVASAKRPRAKRVKAKSAKVVLPAKTATAQKTGEQVKIAAEDIVRFNYERHEDGQFVIYRATQLQKVPSTLYYSLFGSFEASIYVIDDKLFEKLAAIVPDYVYEETDLRGISPTVADKAHDYWEVEIELRNGKHYSVFCSADRDKARTARVAKQMDDAFLWQVNRIKNEDRHLGGYSISRLDKKGNLIRRIDYTPDNIVHGGYDIEKPGARY